MPETNLLTAGGPVLWLLLFMMAGLVALLVERMFYLHRAQIRAREFVDGVKNILGKGRLAEALAVCEETPGPVAVTVKTALRQADADETRLRHAVQETAIIELAALERRLGSVAAIAQVAPLVGLLGTVLGMTVTFRAFATGAAEYATAKALAGGMWQALLCTAVSLALAALARLGQHFLAGRVRAIVRDIEWSANEIMGYLLMDYRARPAGSDAAEEAEGKKNAGGPP